MPDRRRYATWAAFALIAIGAWRVFMVVTATPLLGYGNQFDMRRISACVGLWPDVPPAAHLEAHPQAPIAEYVRGERRPDECYWSSELLFVAPVVAAMDVGDAVDLRTIGGIKAGALAAAALVIGVALRRRPALALVHGLVFALVICDPMVTLWLNTLYTEFSALFFAYVSVAALVLVGARETPTRPLSPLQLTTLTAGLVGLGLARQQHMLLPALLVAPLVISLWAQARRNAVFLVALVAAIAFAQVMLISRHPTIAQANNADVVLGAILPASRDEALTARRLALPERCLRSVGATWYEPMGEALESTCPEALAMPKWRLAALVATEPGTLFRAAFRALPLFQDWQLGYLGSVEGMSYGDNDAVRRVAGVAGSGMGAIARSIPALAFLQCLVAAGTIFLLSAAACIVATARRRSAPLALTLYAVTGIAGYAIATSVFGDGYVEVSRHAHLASIALAAGAVVLASALIALPFTMRAIDASRPIFAAVLVLLVMGSAWLARWPLRDALDTEPMAFGVVDRPERNKLAQGEVAWSGWAIDPLGVSRVELLVGGVTIPARYGLRYRGARDEPLSLYFPAYPDTDDAGFSAVVPLRAPAAGPTEVRTIVVNMAGTRTEIDRRELTVDDR